MNDSELLIKSSSSIIESFFNDIVDISENKRFIIFIDWKNFISEEKNENNVLRNDNSHAHEIYNQIFSNKNLIGFYVISPHNVSSEDIQITLYNGKVDTSILIEKNKHDSNISSNIYSLNLSYIITPSNEDIRYHEIIEHFLKDNYINLIPLFTNTILMFSLTSSLYNVLDLYFIDNYKFIIFYFPTRRDELIMINKFGFKYDYCKLFNQTVKKIKSAWDNKS